MRENDLASTHRRADVIFASPVCHHAIIKVRENDLAALAAAGCDLVLAPRDATELFGAGHGTYVEPPPELCARAEGAARPGHFRGVATVSIESLLFSSLLFSFSALGVSSSPLAWPTVTSEATTTAE